jgi:YD repeat-containing protein
MTNVTNIKRGGYCIMFDMEVFAATAMTMVTELLELGVDYKMEYDDEGAMMTIFSPDKNSGLPPAPLNVVIG